MSAAARRHAVLYGCEIWIIEGLPTNQATEFREGTFAPAPHAHVYAVGDVETAIKVTTSLKSVADEAMYKDLNREHDGTTGR